jgi:hypothetical protein
MATGAEVYIPGDRGNTIRMVRQTYTPDTIPVNHSLSVEILDIRHIHPLLYRPNVLTPIFVAKMGAI